MNKKLILNTLRSVKNTKSRFISIMAIIAIGSGFFAGVKSSGPDMKLSMEQYIAEQGLADFHLMSELGFDDEDVSAAEALEISDEIYSGYTADLITKNNYGADKIIKIYSYAPESGINVPYIKNGRLPEKTGEVFVDERICENDAIKIGDKITFRTGDDREISDMLDITEYTVTGIGLSPVYISFERGSTTIGNGNINGWAIVHEDNFSYEAYTDMYISISEADGVNPFSEEYEKIISQNADILEAFAETQIEHRKNVILDEAYIEINNAKAELENIKNDLAKAEKVFEDGEIESADEEKKFESGKAEIEAAKAEIVKSEAEIANAENSAHKRIANSKMYVLTREYNPAYSNYGEDCDRVDAIANVFPIFFILVAALVCCTTMTRMVEEQRTQIGTLKALGYSRYSIISQYIIYAVAASIPGGFIGLLIGFNTLPKVIYMCYTSMYNQPYLIAPFRWDYTVGCIVAACLCTGLSALFASRHELVSCPAQLMRPKPPKDGKRIFLEHITFIWKRIKFTTKVTFRNLFRYKGRLLMTVVGIAGCTALLLTGYGLQYSITSIVDKQYGEIFLYDAIVALNENTADNSTYESVLDIINKMELTSEKMLIQQKSADIFSETGDKLEAYVVVPENPDTLSHFIDLHERKNGEKIKLDDGIVLGEKTARLLGVEIGDNVYLNKGYPVKVTGICENYTFNYAYITPEAYAQAGFNEKPCSNMIMLKLTDLSHENDLTSALVKNEAVLAVSLSSKGGDAFKELVDSLSMIIVVIIVAAGALAFVVLFNLSNININERIRELATIKVLGFYDGEVAAYVYRENVVMTLLGIITGLILGIALEKFVINTAEVDTVMFSREIPLYCFLAAASLTVLFAVLVNITLYFRMKKIDMAASLKAIE